MKRNEFIKEYKIDEEYEEWFLTERIFNNDLKSLCWKLIDYKPIKQVHYKFNDLDIICTNPNFYTDGKTIAESRKSKIMASGIVSFTYDGKEYSNLEELLKVEGVEVLEHIKKLEWNEVMDWIIVSKKEGRLIAQFDNWDECPSRKEVE